ncbi:hypothetical protein Phpb_00120 [Photorhabdus namnaonensis]|uniref:Uncharacterized protein n=1 Tax=Photorhabdus namnaonensis TaxID=1851568 RepID=A0A1B8YNU7_9GAMM|nr:hypothetical protein Phpb_00120 [Photorhabdus namnaonensis]
MVNIEMKLDIFIISTNEKNENLIGFSGLVDI